MSYARSGMHRLYDLPISASGDGGPPARPGGGESVLQPAPVRSVGPDVRRWVGRTVDAALLFDDGPLPVLPDAALDRYARLVQTILRVPIALVTIVESDRQVFPGAAGLPAELATRETPLSYSFCQHVVSSGSPLVVPDARLDPLVAGNDAIAAHGVIGYAGYPVSDGSGAVIGSLCALDTARRDWTDAELAVLADLAAACSAEIGLRESRRAAAEAARAATDAGQRAWLLVSLIDRLSRAASLADVSRALLRAAIEDFDCSHTGIWIVDTDERATLRYVADPDISWPEADDHALIRTDEPFPVVGDGAAQRVHALEVQGRSFGWLVLQWADERPFTAEDERVIDALAAAVAWAALAIVNP